MAAYTVRLTDPDGDVLGSLVLEFETDEAAVDKAAHLTQFGKVEVWAGERLVAILPPPGVWS